MDDKDVATFPLALGRFGFLRNPDLLVQLLLEVLDLREEVGNSTCNTILVPLNNFAVRHPPEVNGTRVQIDVVLVVLDGSRTIDFCQRVVGLELSRFKLWVTGASNLFRVQLLELLDTTLKPWNCIAHL